MPKREINLLPREELETKPLGKFLLWTLNVGRWIVIVTELVVILAFLSRFKLDRDLSDLYEQIRAKQTSIQSFASFENDFRRLQNQLLTSDKLLKGQLKTQEIIGAVAQATPTEVALSNLAYAEGELKLNGLALSEGGIQSLANSLSLSPLLTEINLTSISRQEAGEGIKFSLTAKVKREEK